MFQCLQTKTYLELDFPNCTWRLEVPDIYLQISMKYLQNMQNML